MGCCCSCCNKIWEDEEIVLRFRGLTVNCNNRQFPSNTIRTRRYSWISFPFAMILLQFKPFYSQFFTAIALLQIFRSLRVGLAFTYYLPLIFIFLVSIGREFYTELGCYRRDKLANSMVYQILQANEIKTVRADELKIGDIIYITPGQNIPADLLILHGTEPLHLKTTNLDGETDYKPRNPCFGTTNIYDPNYKAIICKDLDTHILQYESPSSHLYKFSGKFILRSAPADDSVQPVIPLSLSNTAWMNCMLAKGSATGLVIYTGNHVRIMLGRSKPKCKMGKIDVDINLYVKGLFLLCVFLAFVLTFAGSVNTPTTFIRWIIILNAIIPLAMKVSLEYGKFTMAGTIGYDQEISGIKVQNSNLVEELGLISHIFSDKTGTLTKNEMWLHEIVGDSRETAQEYQTIMLYAIMTCHNVEVVTEQSSSLKVEITESCTAQHSVQSSADQVENKHTEDAEKPSFGQQQFFTDIVTDELLLLNQYIGASPDEVAIIRSMHARGYILEEKTHDRIRFVSALGSQEFELLHVFPFTSETKRMTVVVRHIGTGSVYVFVKGADTVIETMTKPCHWVRGVVDQLAIMGRRTLVYAYRVLTSEELAEFQRTTLSAAEDLTNRQEKLNQAESSLLVNLNILCATGIEDQLQNNVKQTIQDLRRVGIKFWMLTGDQVITSLSTAQACGLLVNDTLSVVNNIRTRLAKRECFSTQNVEHPHAISPETGLFSSTTKSDQLISAITLSHADPMTTENIKGVVQGCNFLEANFTESGVLSHSPQHQRWKPLKFSAGTMMKKLLRCNKKTTSLCLSPHVRTSQGVFFLTEDLSLDRLLQTLHDISIILKSRTNITIVIDGGAIDMLLGTYPTNYFYNHQIHPITGTLLPLSMIVRMWRHVVKFIYIYFTGRVKSGKGSLGPDAKVRELFANVTSRAEIVICCRCTPTQKSLVADIITIYTGKQSLGIGDGANDVPLIQYCAVGVGIAGKEGMQVANAADFVINEFQGLKKLLLWHGRNSYTGSAQMCQFIMQRGITQTLIQIWFSMLYYYTTLVIYTGILLLGFATFFTMFPPFNYYINEDIDYKLIMQYPEVYRYTSSGRLISFKTFCLWLLASITISFLIFMSVIRVLPGDVIYTEFVLLSFSALLFSQLCLVGFTAHRWSVILIIALVSSYASFYLIQTIYPDVFSLSFFYSPSFTWRFLYIITIVLLPTYIGSLIMRALGTPPVIKKLRKMRKPADCGCCGEKCRCKCQHTPIHYYSSTGTYYFNLTDKTANILACKYCSKCGRKPQA